MTTPPDVSLFAGGPVYHNDAEARDLVLHDDNDVRIRKELGGTGNRDSTRRTIQRRAQAEYAQHKRIQSNTRFTIKTDGAGNMLTNKLRVTSRIKQLMGMYVDVAQIHYEDDDHQFLKVESIVRDSFQFEPPLREGWFPEYMRKRVEKSRSLFRKHFEEKGTKHPQCSKNSHYALLAWWASPQGSSKAQRMRDMNSKRAAECRALTMEGLQQDQTDPEPSTGQSKVGMLKFSPLCMNIFQYDHSCVLMLLNFVSVYTIVGSPVPSLWYTSMTIAMVRKINCIFNSGLDHF